MFNLFLLFNNYNGRNYVISKVKNEGIIVRKTKIFTGSARDYICIHFNV